MDGNIHDAEPDCSLADTSSLDPPDAPPQRRSSDGPDSTQRLRRIEARQQSVLGATGGVACFVNSSGQALEDQPAWCAYTGQTPDELRARGWMSALHPEDRERVEANWGELVHGDMTTSAPTRAIAARLISPLGAYRAVELRFAPVRETDGTVAEYMVYCQELPPTLGAATRTESQAAVLEALFDSIADGVIIFDDEGRVRQMNTAMRDMFGLPREASVSGYEVDLGIQRLNISDAHGTQLRHEDLLSVRVLRGELLAAENTVDIVVHTLDGREHILNLSAGPITDQQGNRTGAVIVARDVTAHRRNNQRAEVLSRSVVAMAEALMADSQTQETMAERRRISRQIADLARDVLGCERLAIFACDSPQTYVHPFQVAGLAPEIEQQYWGMFATPTTLQSMLSPRITQVLLEGKPAIVDWSQDPHRADARALGITTFLAVPLHVGGRFVGTLWLDYGGRSHEYSETDKVVAQAVARLVAIAVDRENLLREWQSTRQREERLRAENKRMDVFLSYAGHELRDPLTSLSLRIQQAVRALTHAMQMLDDTTQTVDVRVLQDVRAVLRRTEQPIDILDQLTGELLDVSRIQMDKLQLRKSPFNLADLVNEVVEQQRQAAPARDITLALDSSHAPVHADRQRIAQVITNFLTNAVKYSPAGTQINVRLRLAHDWTYLQVRDQGPGLTASQQEQIWEPFTQFSDPPSLAGNTPSLGLGLYISRALIRRHGGVINVSSVPGHGSIFWFGLPTDREGGD